jgi:hypothetical protein
VNVPS